MFNEFTPAGLAGLLALSVSSAVSAQQAEPRRLAPNEVIEAITLDQVRQLVVDQGGTVSAAEDGEILAKIEGRNVYFAPAVCDEAGACRGLEIFGIWSASVPLEPINRFNTVIRTATALSTGDALVVKSYIIFDGGVTYANVRAQSDVFATLFPFIEDLAFGSGPTAALDAPAAAPAGAGAVALRSTATAESFLTTAAGARRMTALAGP